MAFIATTLSCVRARARMACRIVHERKEVESVSATWRTTLAWVLKCGYDSNVFPERERSGQQLLRDRSAPLLADARRRAFWRPGPPPVEFKAGVSGSLKHYFETDAGTNIGAGQDAKLTCGPARSSP